MINRDLIKEAIKIKYYIYVVIAIGIGTGFVAVFQAKALSTIIDSVFIKGFTLEETWVWMTILLFFILLRGSLIWISEVVSVAGVNRIKYSLRQRLQKAIFTAGPVHMRNEDTGTILNMSVEGIEALEAYFSEYLPQLAVSLLTPILLLFFVYPVDTLSGIIMLVTAPLIPVFMILIGKWANELSRKQWESLSRLGGHFLDMLYGLPTLKLFGRSKSQSKVIYKFSENLRKDTMGVLRVAFLSALTLELVATLSTAIIAVTLGLRLIYGKIPFQTAFFLLLLIPEYYQPLRQLGAKFHAGMSGDAAAKDIFSFLKKHQSNKTEQVKSRNVFTTDTEIKDITFNDVSYNYEDGSTPVLRNISFSITKGEYIAFVGRSGAGKSTLLNLLLGLVRPVEGRIFINGTDIEDISTEDLRRNIGFISQHPYIFSGTILENLNMAKPEANIDDVILSAKLSGADAFISKLALGYETKLGEGGLGLSGGEKRLLAITRVFLKNSSLIIMDEPTASLDSENEKQVIEVLKRLTSCRMVLLVTHSMSLIKDANRILVIEEGYLTESSSHEKLLDHKDFFDILSQ
jgi:ATP-binding cassette, subfamily C, bacterial CydD